MGRGVKTEEPILEPRSRVQALSCEHQRLTGSRNGWQLECRDSEMVPSGYVSIFVTSDVCQLCPHWCPRQP